MNADVSSNRIDPFACEVCSQADEKNLCDRCEPAAHVETARAMERHDEAGRIPYADTC